MFRVVSLVSLGRSPPFLTAWSPRAWDRHLPALHSASEGVLVVTWGWSRSLSSWKVFLGLFLAFLWFEEFISVTQWLLFLAAPSLPRVVSPGQKGSMEDSLGPPHPDACPRDSYKTTRTFAGAPFPHSLVTAPRLSCVLGEGFCCHILGFWPLSHWGQQSPGAAATGQLLSLQDRPAPPHPGPTVLLSPVRAGHSPAWAGPSL